jgi:hypothetical protein
VTRVVQRGWLVGTALLFAVSRRPAFYISDADRRQQQQRATQHQAANVLGDAVRDVLRRELAVTIAHPEPDEAALAMKAGAAQ